MRLAAALALCCAAAAAQAQPYPDYVADGVYRSSRPALGDPFPDLAYVDARGGKRRIGELAGKVVVLHFWGSWCAPCRREMPEMQKVAVSLKSRRDIAFVLLQVREPIAVSKRWAAAQGLKLPLGDSGAQGESDSAFRLADGSTIGDRDIASLFPTTYILDKRGMVAFSHVGPLPDWSRQRAFLLEVAQRPGH